MMKDLLTPSISFCFPYQTDEDLLLEKLSRAFFDGEAVKQLKGPDGIGDHYLSKRQLLRSHNGQVEWIGGDEELPDTSLSNLAFLDEQVKLVVYYTSLLYGVDHARIQIRKVSHPIRVVVVTIYAKQEVLDSMKEAPGGIGIIEKPDPSSSVIKLVSNSKSDWDYFRRKIGICGPPASGKTVKARAIANEFSCRYNANTELLLEYARNFITLSGGRPSFEMQPLIGQQQELLERNVDPRLFCVTDSPAFLAYVFAAHLRNESALTRSDNIILSSMYERALDSLRSYSDIILLKPLPVKKDGVRYQTDEDCKNLHAQMKGYLLMHKVPFAECNCVETPEDIVSNMLAINTTEF